MKDAAREPLPKQGGSTQKFTEIEDIHDDIVILAGGNACLIIEVQSTNFALLSNEEQQGKIRAYASFLNSLSQPIQIVIRSKKVDVSSYLKLLKTKAQETANEKLAAHIWLYRDFVEKLIKINTVLDKKFYIVISYTSLEKGPSGVFHRDDFATQAQNALHAKADPLLNELARLSLHAKILEKERLIKLFYDIYNQGLSETHQIDSNFQAAIVSATTAQKQP
ncbi:MAG: hypothetical protein HY429_02655 [Candidatus Levybacteria bacterium]|nr:hypothetical protein [Candidatus Levybacteria bacterium]